MFSKPGVSQANCVLHVHRMGKTDERNSTCGAFFPAVTISCGIQLARCLSFLRSFVRFSFMFFSFCPFLLPFFLSFFLPSLLSFFLSFLCLYLSLTSLSVSLTTKTIFKLQLTPTSRCLWRRCWVPQATLKEGLQIPFGALTIALLSIVTHHGHRSH